MCRALPKGLAANAAAVLALTTGRELPALREAALERGLLVVALPAAGQETTDYEAFRDVVGRTAAGELGYLAVLVSGAAKPVRAVTGSLALLR